MAELIQKICATSAPMFWLIVFIISAVVEGGTAALVSIWFMGGALISLILSLLRVPFTVQVIVFFVSSALLLMFTRPIAKKWLKVGINKTNLDQVVGKRAKVTETINNGESTGEVYIDGKHWTARNIDDSSGPIEVGSFVKINSIQGVKLLVEYIKDTEE